MISWKNLPARTFAVGTVIGVFVGSATFVGVKLAGADPGGPPTRRAFTYAGVLRNPDGGPTTSTTSLTFVFHRMGLPDCRRTDITVTPNAAGAFSVPVPIDGCPSTFFNGADVNYDIFVAGEDAAVVSDAAITPVPYAHFADEASGRLATQITALEGRTQQLEQRLTTRALISRNTGAWNLIGSPTNVSRIEGQTNNRVRVYFTRAYQSGGGGVTTATPSVSVGQGCSRCTISYINNVGTYVDVAVHQLVIVTPDGGSPSLQEVEPTTNPYEVAVSIDGIAAP